MNQTDYIIFSGLLCKALFSKSSQNVALGSAHSKLKTENSEILALLNLKY